MPNPNPLDPEGYLSSAITQVTGSTEDDPDKAARALDLEKDSGVPAGVIHDNYDRFSDDYRAATSAAIVRNNPHLVEYVNSHPLAAKVSNDDWDNLDTFTQKLNHFVNNDSVVEAIKGFHQGYNEAFPQGWYMTPETIQNYPRLSALSMQAMAPFEAPFRAFTGAMEALERGYAAAVTPVFGDSVAKQQAADIRGMIETRIGLIPGVEGQTMARHYVSQFHDAVRDGAPYVAAGRMPETGINTVFDQIKSIIAKHDVTQLKDLLTAATHTNTAERSPEMLANLGRIVKKDASIGIESDAVRQLYGDKQPAADDGLLGWVPNLADQLATTAHTGGDIEVPLADWLARAKENPEVAKNLLDFVRTRPGAMTVNEGKVLKPALAASKEPFEDIDVSKEQEANLEKRLAETPPPTPQMSTERFEFEQRTGSQLGGVSVKEPPELPAKERAQLRWGVKPALAASKEPETFGQRVQTIANRLEGELGERVSIGTIYDNYGRDYPDAGSLDSFKARLVEAGKKREVELSRSDMPDRFPGGAEERARSEAKWGDDTVHFVVQKPRGARILSNVRQAASIPEPAAPVPLQLQGLSEPKAINTVTTSGPFHAQQVQGKSTTLRSALSQTKAGYYFYKLSDRLASRINIAAGDIPLHIVSEDEWKKVDPEDKSYGYFDPNRSQILLREGLLLRTVLASRIIYHEGIHAATYNALETNPTLKKGIKAIMDEVKEQFPDKIDEYGLSNEHEFLTEAMTRPSFQDILGNSKISPELAKALFMPSWAEMTWWGAFKHVIAEYFSFREPDEYTGLDAALRMTDLTMTLQAKGRSKIFEKVAPLAAAKEPELPGMTRMEDRELFEKGAMAGLTPKEIRRRQGLIEAQQDADKDFFKQRALKEETKRQTEEWKANESKIRDQVKTLVGDRPDIAADEFLRTGTLEGRKIPGRWRLNEAYLTDEQKAALPDDYYSPRGMHPDDVAQLFGYDSGHSLIDSIASLQEARGNLGPRQYINKLVAAETEAQMQAQFGKLEDNILRAAEEHVVSPSQLDLVHEQVLAAGLKAGAELPLSKDDLVRGAKALLAKMPLKGLTLEKFLRDSGKAGRLASIAGELEDDHVAAYKFRQQQEMALIMGNEVKKLEKEKAQAERLIKRLDKPVEAGKPPIIPADFLNFANLIMSQVGRLTKRSLQHVNEEIAAGHSKNLSDFIDYNLSMLRELAVADMLEDGSFRKPWDDLTVEEFQAVHGSLKSLYKVGQEEKKIYRKGQADDLEAKVDQMVENLREFGQKNYDAKGGRWLLGFIRPKTAHIIRKYGADILQLESLFNRFDRGDPFGVWTQWGMRDLIDGNTLRDKRIRQYSKRLAALDDGVDLKEQIPNTIFKSPETILAPPEYQKFMPMTRENLRRVILYWGSESGQEKLSKGYGVDPGLIKGWLDKYSKKEDWEYAKAMGEIYRDLKRESDQMYRNLSGVAPEGINLAKLDTPHGTYDGWYSPLEAHPLATYIPKALRESALEGEGYFRAGTPAGYTKKRTGAIYPLDLSLDRAYVRIGQIIHDTAMREPVVNASKIFYNPKIKAAITSHYGREYAEQLEPYLKYVANSENRTLGADAATQSRLESIRQNAVMTLIGLNPGTVMKHTPTAAVLSAAEVGPVNFMKAIISAFKVNDETSTRNWRFAFDNSEELNRRSRNWMETPSGGVSAMMGKKDWRGWIGEIYTKPVAVGDMISSVPTWLAKYSEEMEKNGDHSDAVYLADRSVRRAHGSTAMTARVQFQRNWPWFSSIYGFWSRILNRQYEGLWKAKDALTDEDNPMPAKLAKAGGIVGATLFVTSLWPALVEELTTPSGDDKKKGLAKRAAMALGRGMTQGLPIIRDLSYAWLEGRDPAAGLTSVLFKSATDPMRDLMSGKAVQMDKANAAKFGRDMITGLGVASGLTVAQEGKIFQYLMNYYHGHEQPRGPFDLATGLRFGQTKGHPRTFSDYIRQLEGPGR